MRKRHEAAEHEEIVQAEAPHADGLQGDQPLTEGFLSASCRYAGFGGEKEDHSRHRKHHRIDLRELSPLVELLTIVRQPIQHPRCTYRRERRAGVPCAEYPQGRSLQSRGKPYGCVGDADRKTCAGKTEPQAGHEEMPIGVAIADQEHGDCGHEQKQAVYDPAAPFIRRQTQWQAKDRAGEHRDPDEPSHLGRIPVMYAVVHQERDEHTVHHPRGEADRECERVDGENPPRSTLVFPCQIFVQGNFSGFAVARRRVPALSCCYLPRIAWSRQGNVEVIASHCPVA